MSKRQASEATQTRIFEVYASGGTVRACAVQLKLDYDLVKEVVNSDAFQERLKEFRANRLEGIARRLETSGEIAILALMRTAAGQPVAAPGQLAVGTSHVLAAADSILDRVGFPRGSKQSVQVKSEVKTEDKFAGWTEDELRAFVETGEEPKPK